MVRKYIKLMFVISASLLIMACGAYKEGSRQDDAFKNKKSASSQSIKKKDCISCPVYN